MTIEFTELERETTYNALGLQIVVVDHELTKHKAEHNTAAIKYDSDLLDRLINLRLKLQ